MSQSPTDIVMTALFRKVDCHNIPVADLDAALAFYRDGLGHELIWRNDSAAGLRLPDSDVELVLHTDGRPIETDLLVASVPAAISRFVEAGGKVIAGPLEIRIGLCAMIEDPWQNRLVILDSSKGLLRTDTETNVYQIKDEIGKFDSEILPLLERRDGAEALVRKLPNRISPSDAAQPGNGQRLWELVGIFYMTSDRLYEALAIFWALYQQMLRAQSDGLRVHKAMPLVWMSDCYSRLGFRVHAKRYLMLTLCEDALAGEGTISSERGGVYFRLVWRHGLRDAELRRYAEEFWKLSKNTPKRQGSPRHCFSD